MIRSNFASYVETLAPDDPVRALDADCMAAQRAMNACADPMGAPACVAAMRTATTRLRAELEDAGHAEDPMVACFAHCLLITDIALAEMLAMMFPPDDAA